MADSNLYRRYCRVCWYGERCWRIALRGSFASATNWGGIIGAGLLALVFQRYGSKIMPAEAPYEIVAQGLIYILAAWVVIFFFRLIFVAPFQISREGKWFGKKFVYREPKLAFHHYMPPEDNNRVFKFRFRDAPPFAQISYKFVLEAPSNFLSIRVDAHPNGLPEFKSVNDSQYKSGTFGVNKNRDMYVKMFLEPGTSPFSVRIYVEAWEELALPEPPVRESNFEPARWG